MGEMTETGLVLPRRGLLRAMLAAPMIVQASSLMRIRPPSEPFEGILNEGSWATMAANEIFDDMIKAVVLINRLPQPSYTTWLPLDAVLP